MFELSQLAAPGYMCQDNLTAHPRYKDGGSS